MSVSTLQQLHREAHEALGDDAPASLIRKYVAAHLAACRQREDQAEARRAADRGRHHRIATGAEPGLWTPEHGPSRLERVIP